MTSSKPEQPDEFIIPQPGTATPILLSGSTNIDSPNISEPSLKYRNTLTHSSQLLAQLRGAFRGDGEYSSEDVFVASNKKGGFLSTIDPESEAAHMLKKKDSFLKFSAPVSSYNSIRETTRINQQTHRNTESGSKSIFGLFLIVFYEIHSAWRGLWRLLRTKKLQVIFMTIDFLVDALYSALYLVELQFNISNFNAAEVVDKEPRWLYVNRPYTIFWIAVSYVLLIISNTVQFVMFQCRFPLFQSLVLG
jgi:hypothetical protein